MDTESDNYMEFITDSSYGTLKLEVSGTNFFDACRENIQKVIWFSLILKIFNLLMKM